MGRWKGDEVMGVEVRMIDVVMMVLYDYIIKKGIILNFTIWVASILTIPRVISRTRALD